MAIPQDTVGATDWSRAARRAVVWDARNSSSLLAARSLSRAGWFVHWLGAADSPTRAAPGFDALTVADGQEAVDVLCSCPPDALFLHGDAQVRLLLGRWSALPAAVRAHLADRSALEVALSKDRSMEHARRAGVPSLPTHRCSSPAEAAAAGRELAPGGAVVLKGEGSSGGSSVLALRAGERPTDEQWRALTQLAPTVMVQRRIFGPRLLVTVVYEHGIERAACAHEKVLAFPEAFGITARGITRFEPVVLDHARRIFETLFWHGPANVEFRQDLADGRWYFMEINPRVASSIGIQAAAGIDIALRWAAICAGEGRTLPPPREYRAGVEYAWALPSLSLALQHPFAHGVEAARVLTGRGDWDVLDGAAKAKTVRTAAWLARHRS